MLSAPPSPASDFRLPLPSLLIRLATPRGSKLTSTRPSRVPAPACGASPRAGEGSGTRTMVTRSALPTPCFPRHRHRAPPGRRVRSGKRGTGTGSLPHPAESAWSAGRVQILDPPARTASLPALSPGAPAAARAREEAARAEGSGARGRPAGSPLLVAVAQAPRAALGYLPCGGAEKPPSATNERLGARQPPRPGEEAVPALRAWPRRRDVTRGWPQIRPRPRSLPAPTGPRYRRAVGSVGPGS